MRCFASIALAAYIACVPGLSGAEEPAMPEVRQLQPMAARFAPVDIRVDVTALPANERQALVKMIQASQLIDGIFLRQVSPSNPSLLLSLARDPSPLGLARLQYFLINKSPWPELDDD